MLCYVMLCYVMLCYVMLCHVMLCYVMLCYVMLCYVMLCYDVSVFSRVFKDLPRYHSSKNKLKKDTGQSTIRIEAPGNGLHSGLFSPSQNESTRETNHNLGTPFCCSCAKPMPFDKICFKKVFKLSACWQETPTGDI